MTTSSLITHPNSRFNESKGYPSSNVARQVVHEVQHGVVLSHATRLNIMDRKVHPQTQVNPIFRLLQKPKRVVLQERLTFVKRPFVLLLLLLGNFPPVVFDVLLLPPRAGRHVRLALCCPVGRGGWRRRRHAPGHGARQGARQLTHAGGIQAADMGEVGGGMGAGDLPETQLLREQLLLLLQLAQQGGQIWWGDLRCVAA